MRAKVALLLVAGLFFLCCGKKQQPEKGAWVQLFNERDLNDWVAKINHYEAGDNFGNTFSVKDGMIQVRYDHYGNFDNRFGHLFYKTPFSRFHLKLEYRITGKLQ